MGNPLAARRSLCTGFWRETARRRIALASARTGGWRTPPLPPSPPQLLGGLIVANIYAWDIALVTLAVAILTYIPAVTLLLHYLDMRTRILADAYAAAGGVASEVRECVPCARVPCACMGAVHTRVCACGCAPPCVLSGCPRLPVCAGRCVVASAAWPPHPQVLSSLRTVASLGLEGKMLARYDTHLVTAERASISLSRKIFLALSTMNSSMFYVMAAGALFAIWRLVNEYRDTEFDYVYDNNVTYCANRCDPYDPLQVESAFLSSLVDAQTGCADRGPEFVPFRMTCNSGETITGSGNATLAFWTLFSGLTGQARLDSFLDRFDSAGSTAKCTIGLATIYVSTQAVFQGVMGASQIASPVTALTKAATACREVLLVISRIPPIDSFTEDGLKPEHVRGEIEVRDVWFAYPSSPSFHICQGYNLSIPAGSSCALVGPSGSGKSTIVQLLERYYDPLSGSILLDGIDLKEYNVKALRSKIGMVAQEPMLFLGTVAENIALGKPGATREEVEAAARAANAYDFITQNLNDGFDTQVGLGGGKLSGGQKQRVAIARAIIKAPSILMLDEATSALDNASEKVVQASLDAIMQRSSYTSITIAHRLSTIKYSDMIAVVKKGVIVEKGTYDELLAVGEGGAFFELANRQNLNAAKDEETMRATEARKLGAGEPSTPGSPGSPGGPRPGDSSAVEELDLEGGKKHKKKEKKSDSLSRLLRMSPKSDRWLYAVGIACALITGVGKGMFGLLFIRSLTALGPASPDKIASEGIFWAIVFLLVGLGMHACELLFNMCLGVTGEHLTKALRHNMMGKLLTQEIGYFDQESNTMGALTEFLGEKVVLINGLVGERLGMIAQSVTMLVTVIFTMFYWGDWRVTLLVLGCFPVMGVAMGVAMAAMMPMDQGKQGKKDKDADAKKSAGSMVGEVVLGIRTVASFNAEVKFYNDYCETMDAMLAKGKRRSFYGGSIAGLAFGLIFVIFGLEIFYGLYLASVGALFSFELEVCARRCARGVGCREWSEGLSHSCTRESPRQLETWLHPSSLAGWGRRLRQQQPGHLHGQDHGAHHGHDDGYDDDFGYGHDGHGRKVGAERRHRALRPHRPHLAHRPVRHVGRRAELGRRQD